MSDEQKQVVERVAELEHQQWAHWTSYMLDNLTPENIARWRRQIDTPYGELSEQEKESDRREARKCLQATDYFELREAAETAIAFCVFCKDGLELGLDDKWHPCPHCHDLRVALRGRRGRVSGRDGYPTKQEIEQLKIYSGHPLDIEQLINFLPEIWYMPDWGIHRNGKHFELHTAGWSGNEEIIGVLQESFFWFMFWQKSERGGHYYFELPGAVTGAHCKQFGHGASRMSSKEGGESE